MQPPRDYEIRMECPKCQRRMNSIRDKSDPTGATKVHVLCPKCSGDNPDTPHYYDAKGNRL